MAKSKPDRPATPRAGSSPSIANSGAKSNSPETTSATSTGKSPSSATSSRSVPPAFAGRSIRSVLVLADGEKGRIHDLVPALRAWLARHAERVDVELDVREFYKRRSSAKRKDKAPDLVVVLGGDGAILAAVRAFNDEPVPTIGINFGRVGFLASVEASHWQESLLHVFEGRAIVENRMRLVAELVPAGGEKPVTAVALNDAVITRGAFQGMLSIALRDGADWVTNYRCDGLVVSTPSGSTAYSMSAGGPILAPSMSAFVVTPVCPQSLSHRPIVVDGDHELVLHVTDASGLTTLVVDGQGFYPMHEGDSVRITRHAQSFPLLALPDFDAYRRLRERLGWRGQFEPDVFPSEGVSDARAPRTTDSL